MNKLAYIREIDPQNGWRAVGPSIYGRLSVLPSLREKGMSRQDTDHLLDLLNRAYSAGRRSAQEDIRKAIGIQDVVL